MLTCLVPDSPTKMRAKLVKFVATCGVVLVLMLGVVLCQSRPAHCAGPRQYVNSVGMRFVYVAPGTFQMGSTQDEVGRNFDEKRHWVMLTQGFYMGVTEVTQSQWQQVMNNNPSAFSECGPQCPVEQVSWQDCLVFIDRLNKREGTHTYRLPTEAEWEYACRAGSQSTFAGGTMRQLYCGTEPALASMGWYCGNSGFKSHPVGQKTPNGLGLYDMHGNVQEWVLDSCRWRHPLTGRVGVITDTYVDGIADPLSRQGTHRIFRGGGWHQSARHCRSAYRGISRPSTRRSYLGFRLLKSPH